jgi:hypothetical protein
MEFEPETSRAGTKEPTSQAADRSCEMRAWELVEAALHARSEQIEKSGSHAALEDRSLGRC